MRKTLLLLSVLVFQISDCYSQTTINLLEATINNESVCEANVDEITDLMGRPTAINDEYPGIGVYLYYHNQGMEFSFLGTDFHDDQTLHQVEFFLSQSHDQENNKTFSQFSGVMGPVVNGELKMKDIKRVFADKEIEIDTPEDQQKRLEEKGISRDKSDFPFKTVITAKNNNKIIVVHEPTTKFSESVAIACNLKN